MKQVQIIILAGGQSLRMGTDKALLKLGTTSFINLVIQTAFQLSDQVLVVADPLKYRNLSCAVVPDQHPDCGPAGGIHTGLDISETDVNLILPCDLPYLSTGLLEQLITEYAQSDALIIRDQTGIHPLTGIYHKRCASHFHTGLNEGKRRMTDILKDLNVEYFDVPKEMSFQLTNVNTPEAYQNINHDPIH